MNASALKGIFHMNTFIHAASFYAAAFLIFTSSTANAKTLKYSSDPSEGAWGVGSKLFASVAQQVSAQTNGRISLEISTVEHTRYYPNRFSFSDWLVGETDGAKTYVTNTYKVKIISPDDGTQSVTINLREALPTMTDDHIGLTASIWHTKESVITRGFAEAGYYAHACRVLSKILSNQKKAVTTKCLTNPALSGVQPGLKSDGSGVAYGMVDRIEVSF